MTRRPLRIVVDSREQTPWSFDDKIEIVRLALSAGDYSTTTLAPHCAIERKSASDFLGTFFSEAERRERQISRLASLRRRALIVEASLAEVIRARGGVHAHAIVGTVASLVTRHSCPVLFAESPALAARLAVGILTRWELELAEGVAA